LPQASMVGRLSKEIKLPTKPATSTDLSLPAKLNLN